MDLVAATAKSVEMACSNAGVDYRTMNADDDGPQRFMSTRRMAHCASRCARPKRRGSGPAATGRHRDRAPDAAELAGLLER
jgi:hypothetical protein